MHTVKDINIQQYLIMRPKHAHIADCLVCRLPQAPACVLNMIGQLNLQLEQLGADETPPLTACLGLLGHHVVAGQLVKLL